VESSSDIGVERGATVLVVGGESSDRVVCNDVLSELGLEVAVADSGANGLGWLEKKACDLVLADSDLGDVDALSLMERIHVVWPEVPVVLMSASADVRGAVEAMRAGAADVVAKPLVAAELRYAVVKALKASERARDSAPEPGSCGTTLLGDSAGIREVHAIIRRAAPTMSTVLVRGESGTGKELVARLIHEQSPRARGPFVRVHCAALPDTLLESELFGYEKGAFTGATTRKPGRVELAEGGTLFLDEIGDITPAMQVKLLRLLQEKEYDPLGGTRTVTADVRFVAATNRNLEKMVKANELREDLFYRLNVVPIWMPPLRDRPEDIERLARKFFAEQIRAAGRGEMTLSESAVEVLGARRWRGNVRELQNFIERLVVLSDSPDVSASDVQREISRQPAISTVSLPAGKGPLEERIRAAEHAALTSALASTHNNRTAAARLLGISRRTLYTKLEEHGLV
jgi:two-component system response regulator AtoC